MAILSKIKKGFYQDSLKLMKVSSEIGELTNVKQAFSFMATEINKKTRVQDSLMDEDVRLAEADDLILIVEADDLETAINAMDEFEKRIILGSNKQENNINSFDSLPKTIEQGLEIIDGNIAVISVPGTYAIVQAYNALNHGLNVMLFSDNVSIEDEVKIKDYALEKNLIVMGPDCGTAIINGTPLCFANNVMNGNIGIIGASGTGTQELTIQLDSIGCGISHAIGTGGRDLSKEVAGRTTLSALSMLKNDVKTEIIAIVSKPPSPSVAEKVIDAVKESGKSAVLAYLGSTSRKVSKNIFVVGTIEEAVAKIHALSKGLNPDEAKVLYERTSFDYLNSFNLQSSQKKVKGLFTGGTLASEAKYILTGVESEIIDLGDDEYTSGALHPMIDPSNRNRFVEQAFRDENVGLILCDVVLGLGSHPDPASELVMAINNAKSHSNQEKIVIASVIGTDKDPQVKSQQVRILEEAGVLVFPSNQYAAEVAASLARRLQGEE
ncbi:MAG: acyl-CoA synthetase FdrA [Erysipelothrix sp.]|nr:acyl-CoA synthetase FdrA [Erysipelothrix sp.]